MAAIRALAATLAPSPRPLNREALAAGTPVLIGVVAVTLEGFRAFAGGFEEALEGQVPAILRWCGAVAGETGA